ncbi:hypothetical protein [Pseudonocardia sp. DLS-67]
MVLNSSEYTPPVTRATFRRAAIAAGVAAVLVLAVLVPMSLAPFALFCLVGMALGLANLAVAVRSVARFAGTQPSKVRFSGSVLARLAVITVIAFGCALLFRPAGIAVFGGLALFQLIAVASSMVPLIKEIRNR